MVEELVEKAVALRDLQGEATAEGARSFKERGSVQWCAQTVSSLESMWKTADFFVDRYLKRWQEAEKYRVWEKIPPNQPFGTKEAMIEALSISDEEMARARVVKQALTARPLQDQSRPSEDSEKGYTGNVLRSNRAEYLTARIARDHPDILDRMADGEFESVTAAARAAGIIKARPKRVGLIANVDRVAENIRKHYTPEQVKALKDAL